MPLRRFKYITGKTIKNDIKMLRFLLPNHIIASITKEATGVDFITAVIGAKSALTALNLAEHTAAAAPKTSADTKPKAILDRENRVDFHTDKSPIIKRSFFTT